MCNPALPVQAYLRETPRFMSEYGLQAWPSVATVDQIAMFLMFSATQGALGVLLVRLFPGAGA